VIVFSGSVRERSVGCLLHHLLMTFSFSLGRQELTARSTFVRDSRLRAPGVDRRYPDISQHMIIEVGESVPPVRSDNQQPIIRSRCKFWFAGRNHIGTLSCNGIVLVMKPTRRSLICFQTRQRLDSARLRPRPALVAAQAHTRAPKRLRLNANAGASNSVISWDSVRPGFRPARVRRVQRAHR